jgi:hypothetical protein
MNSTGTSITTTDIILVITTAANILLTMFQIGVDYHYKTTRGKPYIPTREKGCSSGKVTACDGGEVTISI